MRMIHISITWTGSSKRGKCLSRSYGKCLPNPDAIFGFEIHLLTRSHRKSAIPLIKIPNRRRPVLSRCMAVCCDLVAKRCFARLRSPALTVADEESLISGEDLQHRGFLPVERQPVRI